MIVIEVDSWIEMDRNIQNLQPTTNYCREYLTNYMTEFEAWQRGLLGLLFLSQGLERTFGWAWPIWLGPFVSTRTHFQFYSISTRQDRKVSRKER